MMPELIQKVMIMRVNLATRIVGALISFTLLALVGLHLSINSIKSALNNQSREASGITVASRMDTLHEKLRMMARDYNNWADVYLAIEDNDLDFVADNYAITAIYGDIFNAVAMFDGSLERPIAWKEGGGREPESSFLTAKDMEVIRDRVKGLDTTRRETYDFYMMIDSELNFISASYLLPDTEELLKSVSMDDVTIAVLARRLRDVEIRDMQRASQISGTHISDHQDLNKECIPLMGIYITPTAFICWSAPRTGDALVEAIRPILVGIVTAFLIVASLGIIAVNRHAQDLVRRERDARVLARKDVITGLPNRLAFNEYIAQAVSYSSGRLALIVIDLNGFKRINDMIGHQSGDKVLFMIGRCIASLTGDGCFAARLGGDEFGIVIIDEFDILGRLTAISNEITKLIHVPLSIQGHSFEVTAAQGAALYDVDDLSAQELLRRADYAMYFAKHQKTGKLAIFSEAMARVSQMDRQIERGLRLALERPSEFHVLYQPIVDATDGSFVRAEALARWRPPSLGQIGPEEFIRVAEDSALIIPLGWVLLDQVCRDIRPFPDLCVSLNISPIQFMDDCFVDELLRVLACYEISPMRIEIELTESVVIMHPEIMVKRLRALRKAGIRMALDDFGRGYSSFGSLRMLPFDTLKIDRSLIVDASGSERSGALVLSVIALGQSMGKKIVGEGVETDTDARFLLRAGCDLLQGYLFGRPMLIEELAMRFFHSRLISA